MDDPEVLFKNISYYMLTVLVGLFIHGFIILPAIYIIVTRKNIFKFVKNMLEALLIALATSSRYVSFNLVLIFLIQLTLIIILKLCNVTNNIQVY
jgi:solute carrier family 1 (glutamate transporter), member 7